MYTLKPQRYDGDTGPDMHWSCLPIHLQHNILQIDILLTNSLIRSRYFNGILMFESTVRNFDVI